MSDMDLSSAAKALLRAARTDTPSAAARSRIWSGVASGLGGAPAASGSAGGAGAPGDAPAGPGLAASGGAASGGAAVATLKGAGFLGGSKLLAVGALFGSTVTVGLAATLIGFGSTPRLGPDPQEAPVAALVASPSYGAGSAGWGGGRASVAGGAGSPRSERERTVAAGAPGGSANDGTSASLTPERGTRSAAAVPGAAGGSHAHGGGPVRGTQPRVAPEDALMRESALVAEARGAFMRRDYEKALAALHLTHGLVHRELEPEELSIEARALRAVGRDAEADAAEATLRSRFPDHALSR